MNFLNGNDKKRIKSALNDKKRNGVKLTVKEGILGGTTSSSKMVQQMTKSVLKSVYMIRNEKTYFHLLSFSLFLCDKLLSFFIIFSSLFRPPAPNLSSENPTQLIDNQHKQECICDILRGQVNTLQRKSQDLQIYRCKTLIFKC